MFDFLQWAELVTRVAGRPEVASTPSEVIHRENKLSVLRYLPATEGVLPIPVVIVPSLVNKYYILDLMPGRSYVEYLVRQGFAVYLLDWGVPGREDRAVTLSDYINRYLANAVSAVLRHAGAKKVALIGYCMGGTLALMYAALRPRRLQGLVLLATPVDFDNDSLLSLWARPEYFDVDKFVDTYGNAPAEVLQSAFMMLRPTRNFTRYVDLFEHREDEDYVKTFLAFDHWVNDAVPVAGETFRQFIKEVYQENRLARGRLRLGGRAITLKRVTCPVLNVVAEHDSIVPPPSSLVAMDLVGSRDKELLKVKGGHHGLSVGPAAFKAVWPKSAEWLRARATSTPV